MTVKHHGRFSIKVTNTETGEVRELPKQDNLILNKAFSLSDFSKSANYVFCFFGTGSSVPSVTDVTLASEVGYISTGTSVNGGFTTESVRGANLFTSETTIIFEGTTGKIKGNISEIGLSLTYTESSLFTRALIKDEHGSPTTISLGASDIVTVEYTYGFTIDLTTSLITSKNVIIGGVSTTVELHWADYDVNNVTHGLWDTSNPSLLKNLPRNPMAFCKYLNPYEGVISDFSDIDDQVTFLKASYNSAPNPSSGYSDGTVSGISLSNGSFPNGNCTGTWDGILFSQQNLNCFTCALTFDPPLVKGADDVFTIDSLILGAIRGI
jgi:hypothetical protein